MRLFKGNQPKSEEDRAAGLRLENIAIRYRAAPEPGEQGSSEFRDEAPGPPGPLQ
jgi:hypothetical protein